MSDESHDSPPDSETELKSLMAQRDALLHLQELMAAKLKACPNDYGFRVWWGFVIVGVLVGCMRGWHFWSILLHGLTFWVAGMFFSVFAIDSAEVQSKIAIFLHRLGENRVSKWLYDRALTIR
jgi:hypothetical protein